MGLIVANTGCRGTQALSEGLGHHDRDDESGTATSASQSHCQPQTPPEAEADVRTSVESTY